MQKKVGWGLGVGRGCQGGCERRIEVIVKMKKKVRGSGWEGQCGCETEVIVKMKKKSGEVRSGVVGGVRVDVNM